ncbi:MAG: hypothetical protein M3256_04800 [Actinomycetota bacterium]|nr:hypothetical protein [Actinomycetota bacterium]MDQ6945591.1 hypothetical protein [Actinomycetota bacterium]
MAASVSELLRRVAAIAEETAGSETDQVPRSTRGAVTVSQELFEVERALTDAARRLANLADALRGAGRG